MHPEVNCINTFLNCYKSVAASTEVVFPCFSCVLKGLVVVFHSCSCLQPRQCVCYHSIQAKVIYLIKGISMNVTYRGISLCYLCTVHSLKRENADELTCLSSVHLVPAPKL